MSELNEYEDLSLNKLGKTIHEGRWSNSGLVEIIKLCGEYLNLKTVPDYCKETGMSYPGAIKETKDRKVEVIFNVKFIIVNE
jgi:hypothetical protein